MKIALYKTKYNDAYASDVDGGIPDDWVRVSEIVDIEFSMLDKSTVAEQILKQLDARELEIREKFQRELNELNDERAKLRALTHVEA